MRNAIGTGESSVRRQHCSSTRGGTYLTSQPPDPSGVVEYALLTLASEAIE